MDELLKILTGRHGSLTRRQLTKLSAIATAALTGNLASAKDVDVDSRLAAVAGELEPWLTSPADFRDVSRGKPKPHSLDAAKRKEVGLTRETWKLNVISDPDNPARVRQPMEGDSAFSFSNLMELAKTHAVRFPKIMTCLNIGCPLGNGIWEGVPLREVIWRTQPTEDLRRVFYYGYHNDEPEQMFRSSLPVGRILEDYFDLPPVILCYKLNGQWLSPERGGPVRVVVPEAYGFKSIKWLTNIVLSNMPAANDTYGDKNNDLDSPLKTFCATLTVPDDPKPNEPFPIAGYAQIGIAGLKKVQILISSGTEKVDEEDSYFTKADWTDTTLLPAPTDFGGGLPDGKLLSNTRGFNGDSEPVVWPLPLSKAFWCHLHPGLPAGEYTLRCRTIDANGIAQPMPRPFRKSGHAKIELVRFKVQ